MFKDGFKLNEKGLESLKIYLANCFGLDKKSIQIRIQWSIDNHNNIINCKKNKF
jgi:DNA-directed RNA polymerase